MSQGYKSFPNQWMKNEKHVFLMFRNETMLNLSPLKWCPFVCLYYFCCHFQTPESEDEYISTRVNEGIFTKLLTDWGLQGSI